MFDGDPREYDPAALQADINGVAPLPWKPYRLHDEKGWAHTVRDAQDRDLSDRSLYADENALLVTVHAFGPDALAYVFEAAAKGGAEAKALADRFIHCLNNTRADITAPGRRRA